MYWAFSGNTSWCASTNTLLVWNLLNGLDVYRISAVLSQVLKVPMKIRKNNVKQVSCALEAEHLVTGSDNGEVYVLHSNTGNAVQVLNHGPGMTPTPFIVTLLTPLSVERQDVQTVSVGMFRVCSICDADCLGLVPLSAKRKALHCQRHVR
jgi:hypothetical protein